MRKEWGLSLQLFGEGGGAAGAAGDGGAGAISAEGQTGAQILADGTRMDHRLAERMEKQRKRHPERMSGGTAAPISGNGQSQGNQQAATDGQTGRQTAEGNQGQAAEAKTPEEEFEELIKGRYRDQYQARFQQGISERFKNQENLQGQLDSLKPMLDALAKQRGIEAGDYEALSQNILDDDSLYEEEAEAAGMTVEAFKSFNKLKSEAEAARAREQKNQQIAFYENHLKRLSEQAEALKKTYPNFDLMTEMNNPQFQRMTSPNGGLTVEQAFYALHYKELAPQIMAAGIQRAQNQIGQSIQANAARPVEGAMQGNTAAGEMHINPRNMSRTEREAIKARVRRGERVVI